MKLDINSLPDDPVILKKIVLDLAGQIERLQHQLREAARARFGPRSEKVDPAQLQLFLDEAQAKLRALGAAPAPVREAPPKPNGHGRKPLPEHLPRKVVQHDVPEAELTCAQCGQKLAKFGEEVTEELEFAPASFFVREHRRAKYACKSCQGSVVTADLPPRPIEKGLPGPGVLAQVAVSKYADHLPLYRLEGIFARHGVEVRRSTLADWIGQTADLLAPIVEEMKKDTLRSKVVQTDDTPVPVQDDEKEGKTRKGSLWVYRGDEDHPHTVYDFTPTHSRDGPMRYLGDYSGYLQADAYKGYDAIFQNEKVVEVACWAHARRYFFEAQSTDPPRSKAALGYIQRLYHVEELAKNLSAKARGLLRREQSRPILLEFKQWLDAQGLLALPESEMGKAIGYALGQWSALTRYIEDGDLAIDNNAAENALRGVAIGRKNWLFAGSDAGGRRAAILYSLIETCKRHDIDPFEYLRDVIDRVLTHPASRVAELIPSNWKALRIAAGRRGSEKSRPGAVAASARR